LDDRDYKINTVGPAMIAKHLVALMPKDNIIMLPLFPLGLEAFPTIEWVDARDIAPQKQRSR